MKDKPVDKATQVGHLGRAPRKFLGAVNTPVFRATTMLFPTVADLEASARGEYDGIGYGTARPADRHRPAGCDGDPRRWTRSAGRALGADRDDVAAARAGAPGRPRPGHGLRLRPHAAFLRIAHEAPWRRRQLLRPAARRRHRARVSSQHAARFRRVARLADVRCPGCAGHCKGRTRPQCARHHGQLLGDAIVSFAPSTTASMCRCMRRPSTSPAIPTHCWGSSFAAKRHFRHCIACGPTWASPPRATTASWGCAACVRWPRASRGSRPAASRWRCGCALGRKSTKSSIRRCPDRGAMNCGSAISPGRRRCSGSS